MLSRVMGSIHGDTSFLSTRTESKQGKSAAVAAANADKITGCHAAAVVLVGGVGVAVAVACSHHIVLKTQLAFVMNINFSVSG